MNIGNNDIDKPLSIIIAEDDEDDYMLTLEAFKQADIDTDMVWVKDGEELMHYLFSTEIAGGDEKAPTPALILLDLNMPKKDGREVLEAIKTNKFLRTIPVIILTTSIAEFDVKLAYDLGVNSFIQKPVRFSQFVDVVKTLAKYWFNVVSLPN